MNDYAFDAAGNTTSDPQMRKFTYDAENKQTKVESINSSGTVTGMIGEYFYDGDGRRVKKIAYTNSQVTETTVFVYDASSKLVAEYSTTLNPTPQVAYVTNDHLGSPRINTNENGTVIARHDYRPYGEEITERTHSQYAADTIRKQFTGYERDGETDLDFAQARYFRPECGRFSTPDYFINSTHVSDPRSWNLYAYTTNNPLRFVDPTGEKAEVIIETDQKNKTGTITIKAKFGVYVEKGRFSQKEIQKQVDLLKKQITETYSKGAGAGVTSGDGYTYTISVNVEVGVYGSKESAEAAGAAGEVHNIVGLVNDRYLQRNSDGTGVLARGYGVSGENFDSLTIATQSNVSRNNTYAHEFGHLLGVDGHLADGVAGLMQKMAPATTFLSSEDYDLALGDTVRNHEQGKVSTVGFQDRGDRGGWKRVHGYTPKTSQIVRAPSVWWDWSY